jgi:hypothetical protein
MMASYADEKKIEKSSMQRVPVISDSSEISMLIYSLDLITKIGKNLPILFLSLASLNVLLAANDFLANNIEFGILNSLFAANGFIFLVQTHQSNRIQPLTSNHGETAHGSSLEIKE